MICILCLSRKNDSIFWCVHSDLDVGMVKWLGRRTLSWKVEGSKPGTELWHIGRHVEFGKFCNLKRMEGVQNRSNFAGGHL